MLEFRGLGAVEVQQGDRLLHLGGGKQRGLLALLMLEPGRVVPADRLVTRLWPDGQADRDTLYRLASRLRRALADDSDKDSVVARTGGYLLAVEPDQVDIHRFTRLVDRGRAELRGDRFTEAADLLTEALSLWRGAALTGVAESVRQGPAARLDELRLLATEDYAAAELALERHERLVPQLRELVAEHPVRERLVGPLMLALHRCGRRGEALDVYRNAREEMVERIGLEPSESLRGIQQRILTDDAGTAQPLFAGSSSRSASEPTGPSQLPPDLSSLTGREAELERILLSAASVGKSPGTVVVTALDGMAGIGKTVLAVHAAHRLSEDFPDGRLFIDLHGFTTSVEPVSAATALDRLLRSVGVPGEQIPLDVDERATLWRDRMAGKRCLLLLDNVATEDQVWPLLPAAEGCLVMVTSRNRLGDLDDAVMVSLDVLSVSDATSLLHIAAGTDRLDGESRETISEAVHSCGRLPLAIRLLAARMRNEPELRLTELVDGLRTQRGRLAELDTGRRSVAAAFDLSYGALDRSRQRLFRLLGLHPGTDFDAYAAATLADFELHDAEQHLEALVDANLLERRMGGRFTFHDLIRAHAADTANHYEPESDRNAAMQRLLDYCLHATAEAMNAYAPVERHHRPAVTSVSIPVPSFDHDRALAWLDAERLNLLALARHATEHRWSRFTGQLAGCLFRYMHNGAHHFEAIVLYRLQLRSARTEHDQVAEARALYHLATTYYYGLGQNPAALSAYRQALASLPADHSHRADRARILCNLGIGLQTVARYSEARTNLLDAATLFHDLSDHVGECHALGSLAHLDRCIGEFDQALMHAEQMLAAARAAGDRFREAAAHTALGAVYLDTARYDGGLEHLRISLHQYREVGVRAGECLALARISDALRGLGRFAESVEHGRQSLTRATDIGDRNSQFEAHRAIGESLQDCGQPVRGLDHLHQALDLAVALDQPNDLARVHYALGRTYHGLGQNIETREHWQQALSIYLRLKLPEADGVRERLAELPREATPTDESDQEDS